ncbi:unnamed protein product [Somion occarium]|uniref:Methionine aminopeptidase n=1 Tax=Somion occarium TaxID=3059160 RepID=A0ABP1CWE7_9APHY
MHTFLRLSSNASKHLCKQACYSRLHGYTKHARRNISVSTALTPPELNRNESEDDVTEHVIIQDPGLYEMILPEEPYKWGVSHIHRKEVPAYIRYPPYVKQTLECMRLGKDPSNVGESYDDDGDGRIEFQGREVFHLRNAARLARATLDYAAGFIKPGATTSSINAAVHQYIISHKAYPSPLHYSGFPKSCCTSVNNIVAHGIPDSRRLQDGDIVNVDVTVYLDGYHGDTSRTFLVGNVDDIGKSLVAVTNEALDAAIQACGPGQPFKGIARAIHNILQSHGSGQWCVSPQFTGHGIGRMFHRPPWILHDLNEEPGEMLPGHCFTIEPCIIKGTDPRTWIFPDGWTASTVSGARSAQAEEMILITEHGVDVLTRERPS